MEAVETFQNEWELKQLRALYRELDVYCALEVGAMYGGSLQHWLARGATVVVVDDQMRAAEEWERWAERAGSQLVLLQGDSRDHDLLNTAHAIGPYQFVFIDADHTYDAVKADWENYSKLVSPDGVVAFHDIVARPGYGVADLWSEIKGEPGTRCMEIVQTTSPEYESKCGIGVVWV